MNNFIQEELLYYITPTINYKDFRVLKKDQEILRELARKKAEIAYESINTKNKKRWQKLNGLKKTRPPIWLNEIPWHEMEVDDELKLITSTDFARYLETRLKRTIYTWEHIRADTVIERTMPCYLVVEDSGFGISGSTEIVKIDNDNDVYSRRFISLIEKEEDIEKIEFPKIRFDVKATEEKYEVMSQIFDGILEVKKVKMPGFWFGPWDVLVTWWGVQEALRDLILKPGLVHKAMDRLTDVWISRLEKYEENNMLSLNNGNYRIGSGGLGYIDELPGTPYDPKKIRSHNLWGHSASQIFSGVSPAMHEEFALQYEMRWMQRFGLVYYGCCEPLDKKINILRKIPNLRKISISPWADLDTAADEIGQDYVLSYKPNPAIFAEDTWDVDSVRKDLYAKLSKIRNCRVEIILKDISTLRYQPKRLWDWTKIAKDVAEEVF